MKIDFKEVICAEHLVGTIQSVIGPVVDVLFASGKLPEIYDAVMVAMDDGSTLVLEVEQQLGNNAVRSVAMGSTDGLRRGMTSVSNGTPSKYRWARQRWDVSST
jgi:F-type H+-transporting ATPase subunit beta